MALKLCTNNFLLFKKIVLLCFVYNSVCSALYRNFRMNYSDFVALIKQNTCNHLTNYKELCRLCLQNKSDGIDISDDSHTTKKQRDTVFNNHVIITNKYVSDLSLSDEL